MSKTDECHICKSYCNIFIVLKWLFERARRELSLDADSLRLETNPFSLLRQHRDEHQLLLLILQCDCMLLLYVTKYYIMMEHKLCSIINKRLVSCTRDLAFEALYFRVRMYSIQLAKNERHIFIYLVWNNNVLFIN